jgi:hypothetical protein
MRYQFRSNKAARPPMRQWVLSVPKRLRFLLHSSGAAPADCTGARATVVGGLWRCVIDHGAQIEVDQYISW